MENQIVGFQQLGYDLSVEIAQIQNPDLAFHQVHILDHLTGLCLAYGEFIFGVVELLDHLDKGLYCERIVS